MNRRHLLICGTVFLAILVGGLVVYSWYLLSNNAQPEAQARIIDFTADTSFKGCLVGVTTDIWFNVTVQNTGKTDITGANVIVEISGVNDSSICGYDNQSLGILHVNETRQVRAIILTDISHFYQVASSNFTAKLIINGTVLDTRQLFPSAINLQQAPLPTTATKPEAHITDFYLNGYYNPVGVVWNDMFLLTYANNGTTDVDNTTITFSTNSTFEMSREIDVFEPAPNVNNSIRSFVMGEPYSLGTIKINETKEFIGCIWNYLGDSSKVHGFAFTATLKSNETLLDQETVMIPPLV
jgi:hypothetical protein